MLIYSYAKTHLAVVGFEPTPPKRLEPKSSALDRSATLPHVKKRSHPWVVYYSTRAHNFEFSWDSGISLSVFIYP